MSIGITFPIWMHRDGKLLIKMATPEDGINLKHYNENIYNCIDNRYKYIADHFPVFISKDPDVAFFDWMSYQRGLHNDYRCIRVLSTGEIHHVTEIHNLTVFDYVFGFIPTTSSYYYLPNYRLQHRYIKLFKPRDVSKMWRQKSRFCNFIYSNNNMSYAGVRMRNKFYKALSSIKPIDALGEVFNNTNINKFIPLKVRMRNKFYKALSSIKIDVLGKVFNNTNINKFIPLKDRFYNKYEKKCIVISHYKFTIAIENQSYPGYNTEKIVDAFVGDSVPIYWGDPEIEKIFNPDAFINLHNFDSIWSAIDYIMEVDNNDALYKKYLAEPPFRNNKEPSILAEEGILNRFQKIFSLLEK